jgi:hypothetical protein
MDSDVKGGVMKVKSGRLALCFLVSALLLGAAAPQAQAGLLVESAEDCGSQILERPFKRWLDYANYTLAPNGTLESGSARWSLSGATVVSGNEPFYVHGAGESRSLSLPPGSSATTAPMCVGLEHPTLRFFARSSGSLTSSLLSSLKVEVLFEDNAGNVLSLPIGVVKAPTSWQPSLPMPVLANLLPLLPGEYTPVSFRFTPLGGASWRIDDVYVDPQRRS